MSTLDLVVVAGTKFIQASKEISKAEYCKIRGWDVPDNENPEELGRLVLYPQPEGQENNHPDYEGYVSWSPKFAFDAAYRENGKMTFGHAIEALKQGKMVARSGWNGKGMFIFMQVPSEIPMSVVPGMQSLPKSVKDLIAKRAETAESAAQSDGIRYKNQIAIVYPHNGIFGWVASPSDVLEEDWCVLD